VGISEWLRCTFEPRFVQISSSSSIASAFYEVQYGRRLLCWICWVKLWDHPRRPIYGRWISRLNIFVMISIVMFKLKVFEYFCRSRLKVLFMHPKFQFLGIWLPKFREHHSRKAHLWADWRVLLFKPFSVELERIVACGKGENMDRVPSWAPTSMSQENPCSKRQRSTTPQNIPEELCNVVRGCRPRTKRYFIRHFVWKK